MKVSEALEKRKSTRGFLEKSVDEALIRKILTSASHAPSGVNSQPWHVAVLTGESKKNLQTKMEDAFRSGQKGKMDYSYYPNEWVSPYKDRRKDCGLLMYSTLGITREDKDRQLDQWAANYRAFDAPVMMIFLMDKIMEAGSFMDFGMFFQSIMLCAVEHGLSTCPQAALGEYPDIIRTELKYEDNMIVLGGLAMGYEDKSAIVNSYRTSREPIDNFTKFLP